MTYYPNEAPLDFVIAREKLFRFNASRFPVFSCDGLIAFLDRVYEERSNIQTRNYTCARFFAALPGWRAASREMRLPACEKPIIAALLKLNWDCAERAAIQIVAEAGMVDYALELRFKVEHLYTRDVCLDLIKPAFMEALLEKQTRAATKYLPMARDGYPAHNQVMLQSVEKFSRTLALASFALTTYLNDSYESYRRVIQPDYWLRVRRDVAWEYAEDAPQLHMFDRLPQFACEHWTEVLLALCTMVLPVYLSVDLADETLHPELRMALASRWSLARRVKCAQAIANAYARKLAVANGEEEPRPKRKTKVSKQR